VLSGALHHAAAHRQPAGAGGTGLWWETNRTFSWRSAQRSVNSCLPPAGGCIDDHSGTSYNARYISVDGDEYDGSMRTASVRMV
jgi:hypothetical protein